MWWKGCGDDKSGGGQISWDVAVIAISNLCRVGGNDDDGDDKWGGESDGNVKDSPNGDAYDDGWWNQVRCGRWLELVMVVHQGKICWGEDEGDVEWQRWWWNIGQWWWWLGLEMVVHQGKIGKNPHIILKALW